MNERNAGGIVRIVPGDPLKTLFNCGGYYRCPKDSNGARLGPLVGYAGKYKASDGTEKQWVGDVYANFAKAEEYPSVLYRFAQDMAPKLLDESNVLHDIDVFCGAPIGGYDFAKMLGLVFNHRAIKAEKQVTALATESAREQSVVIFGRHEIKPEENAAIVEDVCNNFSTTDKLIELIEKSGGRVVAIICLLNRSPTIDAVLYSCGMPIPVISLIRLPINEYRQDDPAAQEDIAKGNVVWKPKDAWFRLMQAMSSAA